MASKIVTIDGMQYWADSLGAEVAQQQLSSQQGPAQPSSPWSVGGLNPDLVKLGTIVAAVNTALNTLASTIKSSTLDALERENRARGELSSALRSEAQRSSMAEYARGLPVVGGALGNMFQAYHDMRQQQLGTRHYAAAAEILERTIANTPGTIDQLRVAEAGGRLRHRYALAPEVEAYQQQLLGISAGPGGQFLQGRQQQREYLSGRVRMAAEQYAKAKEYYESPASAGDEQMAEQRLRDAKEVLQLARDTRGALDTPKVREQEDVMRGLVQSLRTQAAEDYSRAYYGGLRPAAAPSYMSFARAPVGVATAPGADSITATLKLTAALEALRQTMEGVNPGATAP